MNIQIIAQNFYNYSLHIKGYSPATIRRYKYVIEFYCRQAKLINIKDITIENVRALFFYGRTERKWSSNTFHVFYKSLLVFFRWCIKEGMMTHNPILEIEKPKLENRLPSKLTKAEAFRLLEIVYNYPYTHEFIRQRNYLIFSFFIFAGLRLHELLSLRYTDVDLTTMSLFINQGKGNKDRVVPINPVLSERISRYKEYRNLLNKTCPEFFASYPKNSGLTKAGLLHLLDKIRFAFGKKFSIHKLRHTFATLMLEGGCDIYSLSQMMGHSDIKTTTIYLYASAEHLRSQIIKHPLH